MGVTTNFLLKGELLFWYTIIGQQCASLPGNSPITQILCKEAQTQAASKGLQFSQ
jgi:hypothetical protein